MQVQCFGSKNTLYRPCVDCGRRTGNFCELECQAKDRMPLEFWNDGQCTPHCTECERRYDYCRAVVDLVPGSASMEVCLQLPALELSVMCCRAVKSTQKKECICIPKYVCD